MDKSVIARNFSKYAHLYDEYASVQKNTARDLLAFIPQEGFRKILELGSGTGIFTLLLRKKFPDAEIKAMDISQQMIEFAGKKIEGGQVQFIHADAESPDFAGEFDLIASNACFHWFNDLESTLKIYKKYLNKEGTMAFTVFGPETFGELNSSLLYTGSSTAASRFIDRQSLEKILKSGFGQVSLEEIKYNEEFPDLKALLRKIKYSGVRGDNGSGESFTRRMLANIEKEYRDRFSGIKATYQVFFCSVKI